MYLLFWYVCSYDVTWTLLLIKSSIEMKCFIVYFIKHKPEKTNKIRKLQL